MQWIGRALLVAFGLALAGSWIWGAKAASGKRARAEGARSLRGILWVDMGTREEFNESGWHYRNLALRSSLVALAALVLWWMTFL